MAPVFYFWGLGINALKLAKNRIYFERGSDMLKKRTLILSALLIPYILTGCWDRMELNELSITSASAIDATPEGRWVVSFQIIIPSAITAAAGKAGGANGHVPVVVYSTEGATIKDADSKSYLEAPRKLYFGHNSILVIGEEAAKKGFSQMVDLYIRNSQSRETVSIVIASGDGRSILEQLMSTQPISGIGMERILEKQERYLSKIPQIRMYEFIKHQLSPSHSVLVPEITISGSKEVTSLEQLNQTTVPSKLRLKRAAIVKNNKLVGWMSENEALGVAFLGDKINNSSISFACDPEKSPAKDSNYVVSHSTTKISVKKTDDKYDVTASIKAKGAPKIFLIRRSLRKWSKAWKKKWRRSAVKLGQQS
ncbi:Spore germination protein A3 precursor [compost metagenome]